MKKYGSKQGLHFCMHTQITSIYSRVYTEELIPSLMHKAESIQFNVFLSLSSKQQTKEIKKCSRKNIETHPIKAPKSWPAPNDQ